MNWAYSTSASTTGTGPATAAMYAATGTPRARATRSLLRFDSHHLAVAGMSGKIAIARRIAINGSTVYQPRASVTVRSSRSGWPEATGPPHAPEAMRSVVGNETGPHGGVGVLVDEDEGPRGAVTAVGIDHEGLGGAQADAPQRVEA